MASLLAKFRWNPHRCYHPTWQVERAVGRPLTDDEFRRIDESFRIGGRYDAAFDSAVDALTLDVCSELGIIKKRKNNGGN
jgi:hypothetical protein